MRVLLLSTTVLATTFAGLPAGLPVPPAAAMPMTELPVVAQLLDQPPSTLAQAATAMLFAIVVVWRKLRTPY